MAKSELDAYLAFRRDIDTMFYPEYADKDYVDVCTLKDGDGDIIALMIVECDYIDCLWVEDGRRDNGLGYELVTKYIKEYGMPRSLRILHRNKRANEFWRKVFKLRVLEGNDFDNLYEICGLKERKNV